MFNKFSLDPVAQISFRFSLLLRVYEDVFGLQVCPLDQRVLCAGHFMRADVQERVVLVSVLVDFKLLAGVGFNLLEVGVGELSHGY